MTLVVISLPRLRAGSLWKSKIGNRSSRRMTSDLALARGNFYTAPMHIRSDFRVSRWIFFFLLVFGLSARLLQAADEVIALKAARLFDGKSRTLTQNGIVLVQGDKITDVGSNITIPADAKVIDLGDATLSPGFMDAHSHLTLDYSDYKTTRLRELQSSASTKAYNVIPAARATIEAGFTTVRDVGARTFRSHDYVDVSLRNAIAKGIVVGPRMFVATNGIGATGGH